MMGRFGVRLMSLAKLSLSIPNTHHSLLRDIFSLFRADVNQIFKYPVTEDIVSHHHSKCFGLIACSFRLSFLLIVWLALDLL